VAQIEVGPPLVRIGCRDQFGNRHIEDAQTPLAIVATDLTNGRAVTLTDGSAVFLDSSCRGG
jgi:predicted acylesterase/phospholipase RssA